jgi:hypothetical protein
MLINAFSFIKGDFCEFGTLFGDISIDSFYLNMNPPQKRSVFFFDSFEGLHETPEPYAQKILKLGSFAFSFINYRNRLKKFGVKIEHINIIPDFLAKLWLLSKNPQKSQLLGEIAIYTLQH